jgi:hypothetical protein
MFLKLFFIEIDTILIEIRTTNYEEKYTHYTSLPH